jgi:hypothetical protein
MFPPHPPRANRDPREWYQLQKARNRAKAQLRREPLCKFCQERGIITPATIADHIRPHNEFWLGELQSLCHACHVGPKHTLELRGYRQDIGDDGWPLDPRHPANR